MPKQQSRSTWGSKRERSRGTWQLRYTVAGEPRTETFHGTEKQADAYLAKLRVRYEGMAPSMSVAEFWESVYLPEITERLAPRTVVSYTEYYRNHIKPTFGDAPLTSLRPREIQSWLSTKTHAVAKHAKAVLSAMLSRAFALELVDDNVADRRYVLPSKATVHTRTKDVYTFAELCELARLIEGEYFEAAFILAAFGGGQRAEIAGIRAADIFEVNGYAIAPVKRGIHYINGEVVIQDHAKNEYRESFIVVAPPRAARLLEIRDGILASGGTWLYDDGYGHPNNPNIISDSWRRWFVRHPQRYVPFGNLRPSYATWMKDTHDAETVARLLRHSSTEMMHKIYDRPSVDDLLFRLGNN